MSLLRGPGRGRAFFRLLFALAWLAAVHFLSEKAAQGFSHGVAAPLLRNVFQIFLLIVGYGYMEIAWENTREPVAAMGLPLRRGAAREFALGGALGWGMVTGVVLVIALAAHFYVQVWSSARSWELMALQVAVLATQTLAAEIAFRGYPFQKLIETTGPWFATCMAGVLFGLLRLGTTGATPAAMWISAVAAVLLSIAYVRTGALWFGWGLHFAWLASIAILFGQPLAGNRDASTVIQTYADGPRWLTGAEYGPEASLVTLVALWVGLFLLSRMTSGMGTTKSAAMPAE